MNGVYEALNAIGSTIVAVQTLGAYMVMRTVKCVRMLLMFWSCGLNDIISVKSIGNFEDRYINAFDLLKDAYRV